MVLLKSSFLLLILSIASCSSTREVKQQKYAKLKKEYTYEYEFPVVWRAIEKALEKYKVVDRDPEDVSKQELRRLKERTLETDWILSKSRDKYVTYKVNNYPRKKYLQVRFKYMLRAESVMGGTKVAVDLREEIEKLHPDGTPWGWSEPDELDPSRSSELLDRIRLEVLAAPNI